MSVSVTAAAYSDERFGAQIEDQTEEEISGLIWMHVHTVDMM